MRPTRRILPSIERYQRKRSPLLNNSTLSKPRVAVTSKQNCCSRPVYPQSSKFGSQVSTKSTQPSRESRDSAGSRLLQESADEASSLDPFNYTSGRWLYDEDKRLAERTVIFSIPELKKAAASATDAKECVKVLKLPEGLFNRAFLLVMDNGSEVIARIPTPAAGPAHFVTASEVATMEFMRDLGVPIPKVLKWSSNANNEVGAEYIIMEKAQGIPLHEVWDTITLKQKCKFMADLVRIEAKMVSTSVASYGALYYNGDVPKGKIVCGKEDATKFCLGPSVRRSWWEGEKAEIDIDRGPWESCEQYLMASTLREVNWISNFACTKPTDFRRSESQNDPTSHVELLQRYLKIMPFLVPESKFVTPTLLHMDLHMGNIFGDSTENPKILAIIDWQGVEFHPLYLATRYPRMIDYDTYELGPMELGFPALPEGYDEMDEEQQRIAKSNRDAKCVKRYWLVQTLNYNQQLGQLFFKLPHRLLRASLHHNSTNSWSGDIALLRRDLIEVTKLWHLFDDQTCPISFSEDELKLHENEMADYNAMMESLTILKTTLGISEDGWISNDRYSAAKAASEEWKELCMNHMSKEGQREFCEKWWPFSD